MKASLGRFARIWIFAGTGLVFTGLLSACSGVDSYQRPNVNLPNSWQSSREFSATKASGLVAWPDFFRDPRLQALIENALRHNADLNIALSRVSEARALYGIASAEKLPAVNVMGSRSKSKIPAAFTGTDRPVTVERDELNLTAVSYELDFWGRVSSMSEAGRANYLASEYASRAMRISLIAEVATLYFIILELDERIALAQTAIFLRERNLELVRKAVEQGAAARSDALLVEGSLHQAVGEHSSLENQRAAAEHALTQLTGITRAALPAGKVLDEQDVENDLAPGIPSDVIYARPDVIAAEYRLKEAQANIAAARAAFLPKILLTAGLGMVSPTLARLFAPGSGNWVFQPVMTTPLFNGGRTAAESDLAEARKNTAVADYEKTIQLALREISDLLSARASLHAQRLSLEAIVAAHNERLTVVEVRFRSGSSSYIEVLDAQRDLLTQKQAAIQIRRTQLSTAAQLYKALGGGDSLRTSN